MISNDTKPRWNRRRRGSAAAETTRTGLLIAGTLLLMLALGLVAIKSGAVDRLNAAIVLSSRT